MRSYPLDVPVALKIGKATLRKMRQDQGWAIGYAVALPIAAGAVNALLLTTTPAGGTSDAPKLVRTRSV